MRSESRSRHRLVSTLVVVLALSACSGGGGGSSATPQGKTSPTPGPVQLQPNDCHFGIAATCNGQVDPVANEQWDMNQIQAPFAWQLLSSAAIGTSKVKIAIIDTGWDCTHSNAADDLSANVVFEAAYYNQDGSIVGSPDGPAVNTPLQCVAEDTDGHGTNVSGIADAMTNNALGFAGTAFNAQLYEYRIFPTGVDQSSSTADEAAAINDAVTRGVNIINLSLGGGSSDPTEQAAIQNALSHNVTVVAAAGNDGIGSVDFPGAYPGVIAVGASAIADGQPNGAGNSNGSAAAHVEYVASYSNWGSGLGLVAPGGDPATSDSDVLHWITNLYSTGDTQSGDTCTPAHQPDDVCAALFAGTSQATPHVTGAAAILLAQNPGLAPSQIAQNLESSADNICSASLLACPKGSAQQGAGRLNVYKALNAQMGLGIDRSPAATSNSAAMPSTANVASFARRRPGAHAVRPETSQSLLYVHYSASALQSAGRTAEGKMLNRNGDDELRVVTVPAGQSITTFTSTLRAQAGVRGVDSVHLRYAM